MEKVFKNYKLVGLIFFKSVLFSWNQKTRLRSETPIGLTVLHGFKVVLFKEKNIFKKDQPNKLIIFKKTFSTFLRKIIR